MKSLKLEAFRPTEIIKILILTSVVLSCLEMPVKASFNASDDASDPAYSSAWPVNSNGGAGFGPWSFDKDPSQYTIASSPGIDVSNRSWAVTAKFGTSAIRPFAGGNLASGQSVKVSWTFPTGDFNTEIRLLDSSNTPIIQLLHVDSFFVVATNGVYGAADASAPWATNRVSALATLTLTSANRINLSVVSGANSINLTNLSFTGSLSAVALFVDGPNDSQPGKTAFFNSLSVSGGINQVAPPVFAPGGGSLTNGQLITISTATAGASIRYTFDGIIPNATNGLVYSGPFSFTPTRPTILNAIAFKTGMANSPVTSATYTPPPLMIVGNNLDYVFDFSTSWPFVDVFKRARTWLTHNLDGSGSFDSGFSSLIPMDTNGWPTRVPFAVNGTNQFVHTILVTLNEAGTYNFRFDGTGSMISKLSPGPTEVLTASGGVQNHLFTATSNATLQIEIHSSATNDYLRNFHLVLTNSLATFQTQPFHPLFLERLQPFRNLRFMDWQSINDSPMVSWTNRTTPSYYTQANPNGVALEHMVQLCNMLRKDAWICIPHQADDDFVQKMAELLRDTMASHLLIYIEYSNETWNGQFSQTAYVQTQGVNLNLDANPFSAGQKYVALRSAQIWNIFQQVFGSAASARLVKVLPTQSSSPGITNLRLGGLLDTNINSSGILPDVLAIAPYFGQTFTFSQLPPNAPYPTVDNILTNLCVQAIVEQRSQVSAQKAIADAHGWNLVCYEGGQTFQGIFGAENDTNLTAILTAANGDPRMFDRYTEYLDMLKAEGVGLFDNYAYCSAWGKFGSWGSLEYQDQPTNQAPKYRALVQWIAANSVPAPPVTITTVLTNNTLRLNYGPVVGGFSYALQSSTNLTDNFLSPLTLVGWQTNANQVSVTDNEVNRLKQFYRVQVSSP